MGGWQIICWDLVLGIPFLLPSVAWLIWRHGLSATPASWAGFAYGSLVSAFLSFFAWYRGPATGAVARVGQFQLLLPLFTLAFAATFLGERFGLCAVLAATLFASSLFISRMAKNTLTSPNTPVSAESTKVTPAP